MSDVDRAKAFHPERADYGSYVSFADPDGNGSWSRSSGTGNAATRRLSHPSTAG